jgi:hypothetical protein
LRGAGLGAEDVSVLRVHAVPALAGRPGTGDPDHLAAAALRLTPDEMTGLESLPRRT